MRTTTWTRLRCSVGTMALMVAVAIAGTAGTWQVSGAQSEVPSTSDSQLLDRARVMKRPALSSDARNLGLSGLVTVRVTVDPEGEVLVSRAVSGPDLLRQAASKAVRSWEFAPSSDPDPVSGFVVFRFSAGEPYASIVGLREQDVASGPARASDAEPLAANRPDEPAPPTSATRPREVRPAARPVMATGPKRLAPGELTALATRKTAPRYPAAATSARIEGVVIVEVEVDETGVVTNVRAVSGNGILRPAAVDAARTWQFRPTQVDGGPTKVIGTLAFNFRL